MKKVVWLLLLGWMMVGTAVQAQGDAVYAGAHTYYRFNWGLEKSTDGGSTWGKLDPHDQRRNRIRMQYALNKRMIWMDPDNGYILSDGATLGYSAMIRRTTNGGNTWHSWSPKKLGSVSGLDTLYMIDDEHHFIYFGASINRLVNKDSYNYYFAVSDNGGLNWQLRSIQTSTKPNARKKDKIKFDEEGKGTLTTETETWVSKDYGKTWKLSLRKEEGESML